MKRPDIVISSITDAHPIPNELLWNPSTIVTLHPPPSPSSDIREYTVLVYWDDKHSDALTPAVAHLLTKFPGMSAAQIEAEVEVSESPPTRDRVLVGRLTGDRSEQASWFALRVGEELEGIVRRLQAHAVMLNRAEGGKHDITHRGDGVRMVCLSDVATFDSPEEIEMLEDTDEFEWLHDNIDPALLFDATRVCRTELHGIQVWANSAHVTCYDRGDGNYRIESAHNISIAFNAFQPED